MDAAGGGKEFGVVFDTLSFVIDGARFVDMAHADDVVRAVWTPDATWFVQPLEALKNVTCMFALKQPLFSPTAHFNFYFYNNEHGTWTEVCRLNNSRPACTVSLPYVPTLGVEMPRSPVVHAPADPIPNMNEPVPAGDAPTPTYRERITRDIEHLVFEGKMVGPDGLPRDPAELLQLGSTKLGAFKVALESSVSEMFGQSTNLASLKALLEDQWIRLTEDYLGWVQTRLLDPVEASDLRIERRRLNVLAESIITWLRNQVAAIDTTTTIDLIDDDDDDDDDDVDRHDRRGDCLGSTPEKAEEAPAGKRKRKVSER